ncbi:MAG: hypothetical protein FJZ43_02400 [Candidatus Staskawiczbacteria bacterium]|nr:hypothetical protein [Candidatus Staskawiczbacteria bacterium]
MNNDPYISIVITARNDDYQKGGFDRMRMAVDTLVLQSKKYNLSAELIIVDWNPPKDRPLLKDALILKDTGFIKVKFIVVPNQIHKGYNSIERINIINPAAFNVGIRRAKGSFIMATNSDIMFSNELMEYIASKDLREDSFYRAFRYDIDRNVLRVNSLNERMNFCKNNIVQVFSENSILLHPHGLHHHPVLQTDCGGDFILFSRNNWHKIHGYPETNNLGLASDVLLCYMAYLSGLKEVVLGKSMRVYHIDHESRWRCKDEGGLVHIFRNKVYNRLKSGSLIKKIIKKTSLIFRKTFDFFENLFYKQFGTFLKYRSKNKSWDFNVKYLIFEHRRTLFSMLRGERSYVYNGENWGFPKENFKEFNLN